jgi:hypothetical protein
VSLEDDLEEDDFNEFDGDTVEANDSVYNDEE